MQLIRTYKNNKIIEIMQKPRTYIEGLAQSKSVLKRLLKQLQKEWSNLDDGTITSIRSKIRKLANPRQSQNFVNDCYTTARNCTRIWAKHQSQHPNIVGTINTLEAKLDTTKNLRSKSKKLDKEQQTIEEVKALLKDFLENNFPDRAEQNRQRKAKRKAAREAELEKQRAHAQMLEDTKAQRAKQSRVDHSRNIDQKLANITNWFLANAGQFQKGHIKLIRAQFQRIIDTTPERLLEVLKDALTELKIICQPYKGTGIGIIGNPIDQVIKLKQQKTTITIQHFAEIRTYIDEFLDDFPNPN